MDIKKLLRILIVLVLLWVGYSARVQAQTKVNIYGGAGTTHVWTTYTNHPESHNPHQWGWATHAGIGLEFSLNQWFSLTPSAEFFSLDNGATVNAVSIHGTKPYYSHYWRRKIGCNIPVLVGGRIPLTDNLKLKLAVGPYAQLDLKTWRHDYWTNEIVPFDVEGLKWINAGVMGEVAIETGEHWSYYLRPQYILTTKTDSPYLLTLSAGVRYSF